MMISKSGKKLHWDQFQETQKPIGSTNNYQNYGSSGQTYTPKNSKDLNYFKSNNKPSGSINRHSSEEQFKFRTGKTQKSPINSNNLNINNQESLSKNELDERPKIKNYVSSTSSIQHSSTFLNEGNKQQDNLNQKSPKNARSNLIKGNHSPTFGNNPSSNTNSNPKNNRQSDQASRNVGGINSNKKVVCKGSKDQCYEVKNNNAFAFLHKTSIKVSTTYQAQYYQPQGKNKKSNIQNGIITNSKTEQQFQFIKKLGEGKFGKVFIARQLATGFILAIKVVQKSSLLQDNLLTQFIREMKIQAFLDHPNIIKLYGLFQESDSFYVLMELGCHGQLYQIIDSCKILTEESTSFIAKSLLEAVRYMHSYKILHRDIKPENIVFVHGNVKICDFGWTVHKRDELRSTFCGTPLYLSPQILAGHKYDQKIDLWAIGILACELRMGCTPFNIKDKEDLIKIVTDQVAFPKNIPNITKEYKQFIESILMKNPKQRMTSSELLNLPFIRKYEELQTCQELCG